MGVRTFSSRIPRLLRVAVVIVAGATAACSSVARYEMLRTVVDGIPPLPPREEYCKGGGSGPSPKPVVADAKVPEASSGSIHLPYQEKQCSDCHDKTKKNGLIREKSELCYVCHTDMKPKGQTHGPAAVGDCLACHVPHDSAHPSLLKKQREEICFRCHLEKRLAPAMHDTFARNGMLCVVCHDPHMSPNRFFLK